MTGNAQEAIETADHVKDAGKAQEATKGVDGIKVKGDDGGGRGKGKEDQWCKKKVLYPGGNNCAKLRIKINNISKDIKKRIGEFHEDRGNLDWSKPGAPLSETREAHQMIITTANGLPLARHILYVRASGSRDSAHQ